MSLTMLHAVARKAEALTPDAELLARFAHDRDHCAFEELVRRHGPLVWAVCRQTLPHHADAEDAFQAVFLALVRSAASIRDGRTLPAWLHGVAVRVAARAKRDFARRRTRDHAAALPEADRSVSGAEWESLVSVVHEEVQRLPESERTAFVLCDLEGVSQPDAAARLGCPLGSVSGRLCKARQRLLERLAARGIAPAAVVGIGLTAGSAGALSAKLFDAVKTFPSSPAAASGVAAALARGLTEGVAMRLKLTAAAAVMVAAFGLTGGAVLLSKAEAQPQPPGASGGGGGGTGGAVGQPGAPGKGGGMGGGAGQPGAPGGGGGPGGVPGQFPGPGAAAGGPGGHGGPGMPGMGGFGGGFTVSQATVEHKFVDIGSNREAFEKTITQHGKEGWEFCGSERFDQGRLTLVFKKRKAGDFPFGPAQGMGGGGMGGPGGAMGGFGGPGGFSGMFGGGGIGGAVGGTEARVFHVANGKADAIAKAVNEAYPKAIKVIGEPRTNMVIVVADSAMMKQIAATIDGLDGKPGDRPGRGPAGGGTGAGPSGPPPGAGGLGGMSVPGGPPGGMGMGPGPVGSGPGAGGGFGPMGGGGRPGFGGGPPAGAGLNVITLKHATADETAVLLKKVFPAAEVTADSRTNQLIVRADAKTLEELQALLTKLDVQVPGRAK